ncbi:MAG: ABC transporter ATP-binding protein, partial [Pseudomonadota bacterium]
MVAPRRSLLLRTWQEHVARHRGLLLLALVFMIGLALAEVAFVEATRWIFEGLGGETGADAMGMGGSTGGAENAGTVASDGARRIMRQAPWVLIAIACAQALFFYLQALSAQAVSVSVLKDLQSRMYSAILRYDLSQLSGRGDDAARVGDLVSRFTNDMTVLRGSLRQIPNAARDIIRLTGYIAYLAILDPILFLCILIVYPLIGIPITAIGRAIRRVARRVQGQIGDLTGTLTESLSSPEMIKSYRLEERERQRMDNAFEERRQLLMKLIRRQTLNEPAITVIVSFSIAVIIAVAAFRIDRGLMTSADLAAFLVAIAMLSQPARGLGNLNAHLQEGLSVMERAFSVTDVEPRVVDQPGAASFPASANKSAPSIHLDHVSFSYDDHRAVLRDVSLQIPGGSTTALVGPSGAGKSTIFGLLPRFFDCDQGSILINGRPHTSILLSELRCAMSIVSQTPVLFDISLAENIGLGAPGADHVMIVAAANAAAGHDFIVALPQGYDTPGGPGGGHSPAAT